MPNTWLRRTVTALCVALVAAGCAESPFEPEVPPGPAAVARIDVSPATPSLARGAELQLEAVAKAANGDVLADRGITWTSLSPAIATVTATGVVRGEAEGVANVRVQSGGVQQDIALLVTAAPLAAIEPATAQVTLREGRDSVLTVAVRNALGEIVAVPTLTWTSLSPLVATVADGRVTALREGVATLRVSVGTLSADIVVQTQPDFGGELVYTTPDGSFGNDRIHRMDAREYSTSRTLTDFSGFSHPAVSPDGQKVVFTCPSDGPALCVANIDGSGIVRLTDEDVYREDQPTWSPNGSKIAFRRYRTVGGTPGPWNPSDIWVMDANGTNLVNLTADSAGQHWPTWTAANGGRIAFVQETVMDGYQVSRVATMAANGSDRRFVTAEGLVTVSRPRWSPDGSALLITKSGDGYSDDIVHVTVATGAERPFLAQTLPAGVQLDPTFSPNGRYVVFASTHAEVSSSFAAQVYTARADGSDVRLRSAGALDKRGFAWVPTP